MPNVISGDSRRHFLVRARHPDELAQVLHHIEADSSIAIERRIRDSDGLETLVCSMYEAQAAQLRKRFAGSVIVEPDSPLTLS